MPEVLARPDDASAEEARLAQAAAAGDPDAFAELYGRYEQRTYNLCLRILGSEDDAADATQEAFLGVLRRLPKLEGRELAFGSYVFTSARNACYDLIEKRKRAEPSDDISESAITVGAGVGGGGTGFDPGDPEDDPERNVLVAARQDEIRAANETLPERQREALALRELEELSYDEIAEIMGMNRNSVAQLISRARISLRDALRGTALASIAGASPDCERALPLLALDQDGQAGADSEWLDSHLADCDTCRLGIEAMQEAGASYRAWVPVAAAPFLFRETMAKAAELVGADWSEAIDRHERLRSKSGGRLARLLPRRRLDFAAAAALGLVILLGGLAVGVTDDDPPAGEALPAAQAVPEELPEEPADKPAKPKKKKQKKGSDDSGPASVAAAPDVPEADDDDSDPVATPLADATPRQGTRRRSGRRGSINRNDGASGGGENLTGAPQPEPPPPPADPPPTVTEPPTTPPPPKRPCRPTTSVPINCPP